MATSATSPTTIVANTLSVYHATSAATLAASSRPLVATLTVPSGATTAGTTSAANTAAGTIPSAVSTRAGTSPSRSNRKRNDARSAYVPRPARTIAGQTVTGDHLHAVGGGDGSLAHLHGRADPFGDHDADGDARQRAREQSGVERE